VSIILDNFINCKAIEETESSYKQRYMEFSDKDLLVWSIIGNTKHLDA